MKGGHPGNHSPSGPPGGHEGPRTWKRRRRQQQQQYAEEYRRLRAMVPSVASRPEASRVEVIEEAVRYIEQLHAALLLRLQTRGIVSGECVQDCSRMSASQIRRVIHEVVTFPAVVAVEKSCPLPSYLKKGPGRPI